MFRIVVFVYVPIPSRQGAASSERDVETRERLRLFLQWLGKVSSTLIILHEHLKRMRRTVFPEYGSNSLWPHLNIRNIWNVGVPSRWSKWSSLQSVTCPRISAICKADQSPRHHTCVSNPSPSSTDPAQYQEGRRGTGDEESNQSDYCFW